MKLLSWEAAVGLPGSTDLQKLPPEQVQNFFQFCA